MQKRKEVGGLGEGLLCVVRFYECCKVGWMPNPCMVCDLNGRLNRKEVVVKWIIECGSLKVDR